MAFRRSQRGAVRQIGTFAAVGITATVTHYLTALAAAQFVHPLVANVFGYCLAVGVSYGGHHRLTFRVRRAEAHHAWRLPRFILVSLGAVSLSELALWLALEHTDWPLWIAQLAAIAVAKNGVRARFPAERALTPLFSGDGCPPTRTTPGVPAPSPRSEKRCQTPF